MDSQKKIKMPDGSAKHTQVWIRGYNKLKQLRDKGVFPYDITQMRIGAWMYEEGWFAGRRSVRRKVDG